MTKADLIDLIAERTKLPHGRAELLICQMFDCDGRRAPQGRGNRDPRLRQLLDPRLQEYQGRNPRTGEAVHVRPKRLAFFKVGKELRERVNNGPRPSAPSPRRRPRRPASRVTEANLARRLNPRPARRSQTTRQVVPVGLSISSMPAS